MYIFATHRHKNITTVKLNFYKDKLGNMRHLVGNPITGCQFFQRYWKGRIPITENSIVEI